MSEEFLIEAPAEISPALADEIRALQAVLEKDRHVFTCRGCHRTGWRLLIPSHARQGITCTNCGRVAVPDWKCAELLALAAAAETKEAEC